MLLLFIDLIIDNYKRIIQHVLFILHSTPTQGLFFRTQRKKVGTREEKWLFAPSICRSASINYVRIFFLSQQLNQSLFFSWGRLELSFRLSFTWVESVLRGCNAMR